MRPSEILRAAIRNVRRRPLRNGLAGIGVALATALLVALLSLSAGVRSGLAQRLEDRPLLPLPLAEDALAWIATGESDSARDLRLAQQAASALLVGGRVAAQDLVGSHYTSVWLLLAADADPRAVANAVEPQGFAAFSRDAVSRTVDDLFALVNSALAAIAGIALLLAGLGVVNALLTSVSERTAEIGVLKASR